jgi:hypothetical protein
MIRMSAASASGSQRQIQSEARRTTVHGADRRGIEVVEHVDGKVPDVEPGSHLEAALGHSLLARRILEVQAGAERAPPAGDHDGAKLRIGFSGQQALRERREHRLGDRVHPLRSVEDHARHVTLSFQEDFIHRNSPSLAARRSSG